MNTRIEPRTGLLLAARAAYGKRDWRAAYDAFVQAEATTSLAADDLDAMAAAAWRLGHGKEALRVAERVYTQLARTDPPGAAMKAVELGLAWSTRGDLNIGRGWINRARRLLGDETQGLTHAYLAYLEALVAMVSGDTQTLVERVATLQDSCRRLDSPAVTALCRVAEALAAIGETRIADAYALIDEALLPILADELPIDWAGDIYCVVLTQCHRLGDLPRMREWTRSMERWCADFAASATYGGVCDVHRLQIQAASDDYRMLEERLTTTSMGLEDVNAYAAAEGYYQLGEVRRRRGDADGALAAFARARALGKDPQPGEALTRCAHGDSDRAWTDLRVALAEEDRSGRMRLLHGAIDIALARDDLDEAERYCGELESGAQAFDTPGFRAWAAHSRGAILVQCKRYAEALDALQVALREYRTQQSRYETAQVYDCMAVAHKGLGDDGLAAADAATAENIYTQLGVEPAQVCGSPTPAGLTKRELEILRLVAAGETNKQIAERIFISEKTVARHLANVYAKLGVSSRTAAAAWLHSFNQGV